MFNIRITFVSTQYYNVNKTDPSKFLKGDES